MSCVAKVDENDWTLAMTKLVAYQNTIRKILRNVLKALETGKQRKRCATKPI